MVTRKTTRSMSKAEKTMAALSSEDNYTTETNLLQTQARASISTYTPDSRARGRPRGAKDSQKQDVKHVRLNTEPNQSAAAKQQISSFLQQSKLHLDLVKDAIEHYQRVAKEQAKSTVSACRDWSTAIEERDAATLELRSLTGKYAELKSDYDEALSENRDLLNREIPYCQPDDIVGGYIESLFGDIKQWARSWSLPREQKFQPGMVRNCYEMISAEFVQPFASTNIWFALEQNKINPYIIVNAVVNSLICKSTFLKPFEFLKIHACDDSLADRVNGMELIAKSIEPRSLEASMARVSMLRLLCVPSDDLEFERPWTGDDEVTNRKRNHCKWLAEKIEYIVAGLLRKCNSTEKVKCSSSLQAICRKAINMSVQFNLQHPKLVFSFRADLNHVKFFQPSKYFDAHNAMQLREQRDDDEDDEDARSAGIEGNELDLVVEPFVARYGDRHGYHMERCSVLQKAVVWMVKPKDIQTHQGQSSNKLPMTASNQCGRSKRLRDSLEAEVQSNTREADRHSRPSNSSLTLSGTQGRTHTQSAFAQTQSMRTENEQLQCKDILQDFRKHTASQLEAEQHRAIISLPNPVPAEKQEYDNKNYQSTKHGWDRTSTNGSNQSGATNQSPFKTVAKDNQRGSTKETAMNVDNPDDQPPPMKRLKTSTCRQSGETYDDYRETECRSSNVMTIEPAQNEMLAGTRNHTGKGEDGDRDTAKVKQEESGNIQPKKKRWARDRKNKHWLVSMTANEEGVIEARP